MFVNFNILNQLGSPAINSNTFANRPAAGQTGRLFVSTDTFEIYRDNGTTWDLIGGPGSSTITGTGTATQVAYFTSSQAIGSSSNLYWDNTNIRLGIGTATPGTRLDIHGSNVMAQFNGTTSASNSYIAFQRTGSNVWRLGDNYNSGDNFFELRNSVLSNDALTIQATTNKAAFLAQQTYLGGQAQGALFTYNLTAPAGTTFATPNALSAVNAYLNLSLGGNATLPAGTRQGIEGNSRVSFTGAGTLTMSQASTLRAYAAITGVHSFAGSAIGTITHLAGLRLCFPDNIGSAINITNNYGLLINDQSAGTGTITYSNRWGIYQEGASDLNYFAANTLIGGTTNNGLKLQVTGQSYFADNIGLAVIPSAWDTTLSKAIQLNGGSLWGYSTSQINLLQNAFYNSSGDIVYVNSAAASAYRQISGVHSWYTAPSGTAGNTISFSQIMTLTAAGNLGIGTTSPNSYTNYTFLTINNAVTGSGIDLDVNDTRIATFNTDASRTDIGTITNIPFAFYTNGSERMRITSGGNVGIGTTSPVSLLNLYGDGNLIQLQNSTTGATSNDGTRINLSGNDLQIINRESANTILYTTDTERMRITSGGNVLINSTTDPGQKVYINGSLRIDGQTSGTAGGSSGQHLIINCDGTTYKIALLNN